MTRIHAKHEPYTDGHLGPVIDEMQHCGAPTIRAIEYRGNLFALEGSHRLAVAWATGLVPKIIVLKADAGDGLDQHWGEVSGLPVYEFDHLLVMREEAF